MVRAECQDLGPHVAFDADAAQKLEVPTAGLGVAPTCESVARERDQFRGTPALAG
jgi:hypothetical protein